MKSVRGEYERFPTDITECIRSSCSKYSLLAEKKGIMLVAQIPSKQSFVDGNPQDLVRALDSLLTNAIRFNTSGGRVEVLCEEIPGAFQIRIKDNGRGLEKRDIERIWTMGWQAKDSRQGASGFGLSLARQIVHLHQGRIHVENEEPEAGTVFKILIPLMDKKVINGENIRVNREENI
jgi:signal transduction histidine kinase